MGHVDLAHDAAAMRRIFLALGLAQPDEEARAVALAGGVSSGIYRVDLRSGRYCVKQALPKLKVAKDWEVPVERVFSEIAWLRAAAGIVPGRVPAVLGECSRCGEVKPLSEYYKRSGYASLYTHCKQCHGSLSAAGEKQRGPRPNQAERNRARVEKYWSNRAEHLLKARAARYGISVEVARELSESPCHICGAEESGVKDNPMYIDHCHQSGRVRGALCNNCNRYVGLREKYAHLEERYQEYVSDPTPY